MNPPFLPHRSTSSRGFADRHPTPPLIEEDGTPAFCITFDLFQSVASVLVESLWILDRRFACLRSYYKNNLLVLRSNNDDISIHTETAHVCCRGEGKGGLHYAYSDPCPIQCHVHVPVPTLACITVAPGDPSTSPVLL